MGSYQSRANRRNSHSFRDVRKARRIAATPKQPLNRARKTTACHDNDPLKIELDGKRPITEAGLWMDTPFWKPGRPKAHLITPSPAVLKGGRRSLRPGLGSRIAYRGAAVAK